MWYSDDLDNNMHHMYWPLRDINVIKDNDGVNSHARKILDKHLDVESQLVQGTSYMPADTALRERIMSVVLGYTERPHCKMCDTPVKFISASKQFSTYCSTTCSRSDPIIKDKIAGTIMDRYGTTNVMHDPEIKQRRTDTNQTRYGADTPLQNAEVLLKTHATMQDRHGGVGFKSDHNQQVRMATLQTKYGTNNTNQHHLDPNVVKLLDTKEWLIEQHHTNKRTLNDISIQLSVDPSMVWRRFKIHDIEVRSYFQSQAERDLGQWLVDQGITVQCNRRDIIAGELDIYCPDHHIAIEYNGIFWHSEQMGKDRHYHLNKTNQCRDKGIQLIHIFEDEWINNCQLVKSRLASKFKLISNKIAARKCTVVQLDRDRTRAMLDNNHIQGGTPVGTIRLGLMLADQLVACMTFGTPRFSNDRRVVRQAAKTNWRIKCLKKMKAKNKTALS